MLYRPFLLGFACLACFAAPPADFRISGPYTHDNLSIYLLHSSAQANGKYLTLKEAMDQQKVVVYETGQVNQLAIENLYSDDVYIQSGDIVKGGRQDRVLTTDLVLPGHSGRVPIASFCVEHGRWTRRGDENAAQFSSSNQAVSFKAMKVAIREEKDQSRVWSEVGRAQANLVTRAGAAAIPTASPSSMQLTLENQRVVDATNAYVRALGGVIEGRKDVVGYAYAINGVLNSADVYASHDLFERMWPKMLKSSAAEAVAGKASATTAAAPGLAAVQSALMAADRARESGTESKGRVTVTKREADKVTLYESRDRDQWLHKSYVVK